MSRFLKTTVTSLYIKLFLKNNIINKKHIKKFTKLNIKLSSFKSIHENVREESRVIKTKTNQSTTIVTYFKL